MRRSRFTRVLRCDSKFRAIIIYAVVSSLVVSALAVIALRIHLPNIEVTLYRLISEDDARTIYIMFDEIVVKLIIYISLFFFLSTFMAVVFAYRNVRKKE